MASLLHILSCIWLAQIALVVLSPFFSLLRQAGTYGKLRAEASGKGGEEETRGGAQATEVAEGMRQRRFAPPTTSDEREAASTHDDAEQSRSIFLHPSLYIRTKTAFTSYYLLASLWNGLLLLDCLQLLCTGDKLEQTLVLPRIRDLAWRCEPELAHEAQEARPDPALVLILALFQAHLLRRLYESLCVARFSPRSRQHLIITLLAYEYYALVSLTLAADSPLVSGSSRSPRLFPLGPATYTLGVGMFVWGWWKQHEAHRTLASLRGEEGGEGATVSASQSAAPAPAQQRYGVPRGGLFDLVSMPHYFCEMVEYTGLWVLSGGAWAHFLICLWVYSNLSITAVRSHRWYRQQFPDYPKQRRAVLPGLL